MQLQITRAKRFDWSLELELPHEQHAINTRSVTIVSYELFIRKFSDILESSPIAF